MSTERLFLVDPYNDKHIEMMDEFERKNEIKNKTSEYLGRLRASISKEEHEKRKKEKNEIEETLFLEKEGIVTDSCHIQGEKDIKTGRIILASLQNKEKKRKLILLATDYALNSLGLEEVFVHIEPTDKQIIAYLQRQGYEDLGEEDGKIIFLKEKEEIVNAQRMIA